MINEAVLKLSITLLPFFINLSMAVDMVHQSRLLDLDWSVKPTEYFLQMAYIQSPKRFLDRILRLVFVS